MLQLHIFAGRKWVHKRGSRHGTKRVMVCHAGHTRVTWNQMLYLNLVNDVNMTCTKYALIFKLYHIFFWMICLYRVPVHFPTNNLKITTTLNTLSMWVVEGVIWCNCPPDAQNRMTQSFLQINIISDADALFWRHFIDKTDVLRAFRQLFFFICKIVHGCRSPWKLGLGQG